MVIILAPWKDEYKFGRDPGRKALKGYYELKCTCVKTLYNG